MGKRDEKRLHEIITGNILRMARIVAELSRRGRIPGLEKNSELALKDQLPKGLPAWAIPRLRKIGQALLVLDEEPAALQVELARRLTEGKARCLLAGAVGRITKEHVAKIADALKDQAAAGTEGAAALYAEYQKVLDRWGDETASRPPEQV
jgi:hypothetical protein